MGIFKSRALKRRAEELRGIIHAVERIKTGISFGKKSVPFLLSEIGKDMCPLFFSVGTSASGTTVYENYEKVRSDYSSRSFLTDDDQKNVDLFFSSLGRSGSDDQLALCETTLSRLSGNLLDAEEKYKKYGNVFSRSGILAGLFIVILFL